jgi:hypothetical protein
VIEYAVELMSVAASPALPLMDHLCENGFECVEILPSTNDAHGGVIVDLKDPMDPEIFATLLKSSLLQWRKQVTFMIYIIALKNGILMIIAYNSVKYGFNSSKVTN